MSSDPGLGRGGGFVTDQASLRKPSAYRNAGRFEQTNHNQRSADEQLDQGLAARAAQLNIREDHSYDNVQMKGGGDVSGVSASLNPQAKVFVMPGSQAPPPPPTNERATNQPSQQQSAWNNRLGGRGAGQGVNNHQEENAYNGDYNFPTNSNGEGSEGSAGKKQDSDLEMDDFVALSELKEFIDNISSQPAHYDSHLPFITDVLNEWMGEDPDILMLCVVNTIVDQTITDQNFRYNGVRLCVHLVRNLVAASSNGKFKDVLLQRCRREHRNREELAWNTDGGLHLRGLTLFIGELSTHFSNDELINFVPDLINTLLARATSDNLKCACMAMKLCGSKLDQHGQNQKAQVDNILKRLQAFVNNDTTSSVKELINNVIELRENGWNSVPRPGNLVNPYASGDFSQNYFDDDSVGYDFGGDENNGEVCDAFEEFLRASGQLN